MHVLVLLGLWTALPARLARFLPWLCLPAVITTVLIQGTLNGSLEASSRDGFLASTLTASLITAFVSGKLLAYRMPHSHQKTCGLLLAAVVGLCAPGVLYYLKACPLRYLHPEPVRCKCFCSERELQIPD